MSTRSACRSGRRGSPATSSERPAVPCRGRGAQGPRPRDPGRCARRRPGRDRGGRGPVSNPSNCFPPTALDRVLTRRRLTVALAMLTVERSLEAAERHLVRPARARILPAGAIIVDAILERYGTDRLRVSDEGDPRGPRACRRGRGARLARSAAAARARLVRRGLAGRLGRFALAAPAPMWPDSDGARPVGPKPHRTGFGHSEGRMPAIRRTAHEFGQVPRGAGGYAALHRILRRSAA